MGDYSERWRKKKEQWGELPRLRCAAESSGSVGEDKGGQKTTKANRFWVGKQAFFFFLSFFFLWLQTTEFQQKGVKLITKWAGVKQASAKQNQILRDKSRLNRCDKGRELFRQCMKCGGESAVTNEGFTRVLCVEEGIKEKRKQRTPVNRKNTFHIRFIDSSEQKVFHAFAFLS